MRVQNTLKEMSPWREVFECSTRQNINYFRATILSIKLETLEKSIHQHEAINSLKGEKKGNQRKKTVGLYLEWFLFLTGMHSKRNKKRNNFITMYTQFNAIQIIK